MVSWEKPGSGPGDRVWSPGWDHPRLSLGLLQPLATVVLRPPTAAPYPQQFWPQCCPCLCDIQWGRMGQDGQCGVSVSSRGKEQAGGP